MRAGLRTLLGATAHIEVVGEAGSVDSAIAEAARLAPDVVLMDVRLPDGSGVEAGEIFHPLRWNSQEAFQFLRDVPLLESAGVVVRIPASWRMNRPARPQVKATVGGKPPAAQLGLDALLDFQIGVTLDGKAPRRVKLFVFVDTERALLLQPAILRVARARRP